MKVAMIGIIESGQAVIIDEKRVQNERNEQERHAMEQKIREMETDVLDAKLLVAEAESLRVQLQDTKMENSALRSAKQEIVTIRRLLDTACDERRDARSHVQSLEAEMKVSFSTQRNKHLANQHAVSAAQAHRDAASVEQRKAEKARDEAITMANLLRDQAGRTDKAEKMLHFRNEQLAEARKTLNTRDDELGELRIAQAKTVVELERTKKEVERKTKEVEIRTEECATSIELLSKAQKAIEDEQQRPHAKENELERSKTELDTVRIDLITLDEMMTPVPGRL